MPHKHTRRKDGADPQQFDLPPTTAARPLPVGKQSSKATEPKSKQKKKRRRGGANPASDYGPDDTPKAFARLMHFASKPRGGRDLDDGGQQPRSSKSKDKSKSKPAKPARAFNKNGSPEDGQKTATENDTGNGTSNPSRKRKRGQDNDANTTTSDIPPPDAAAQEPADKPLEILPGESLRDFSARVDRAMPLTGLARRGKDPGARVTKHEKRLRKLQDGWRAEEARIREREEEEKEEEEEREEEMRETYGEEVVGFMKAGGKKWKGAAGAGEDPWAVLKKKREAPKGLHDVVTAPPQFDKLPKEKFKVRDGAGVRVADVPGAAGSLRRREQLGDARRAVIDGYRRMMQEKRAG